MTTARKQCVRSVIVALMLVLGLMISTSTPQAQSDAQRRAERWQPALSASAMAKPNLIANGQLSFADWLARQSTRCKDLDGDGTSCELYEDQYMPANRSYIYFTSPKQGLVGVVDFLGISSSYLKSHCGVDLGTTVTGSIAAHDVGNGRVLVVVVGHAKNAMAFVTEDPINLSPFAPPIFGAKEADVCSGAEASVVDAEFQIEYYTNASQPIVDNQWFGNPPPTVGFPNDPFDFRFITLRVQGVGTLADGSKARLVINQTGTLQSHSQRSNFDGFSVEFVNLIRLGQ